MIPVRILDLFQLEHKALGIMGRVILNSLSYYFLFQFFQGVTFPLFVFFVQFIFFPFYEVIGDLDVIVCMNECLIEYKNVHVPCK